MRAVLAAASSQEGQLCQVAKGFWFFLVKPRLMICCSAFPRTASSFMPVPCHCFLKNPIFAVRSMYRIMLSPCLNFLWSKQLVVFFLHKNYLFPPDMKEIPSWLPFLGAVMETSISIALLLSHSNRCFWPLHSTFGWVLQENTLLLALSVISNGQKLHRWCRYCTA